VYMDLPFFFSPLLEAPILCRGPDLINMRLLNSRIRINGVELGQLHLLLKAGPGIALALSWLLGPRL
jgi:hypothetical protein